MTLTLQIELTGGSEEYKRPIVLRNIRSLDGVASVDQI